jgi:hypothetical protein
LLNILWFEITYPSLAYDFVIPLLILRIRPHENYIVPLKVLNHVAFDCMYVKQIIP